MSDPIVSVDAVSPTAGSAAGMTSGEVLTPTPPTATASDTQPVETATDTQPETVEAVAAKPSDDDDDIDISTLPPFLPVMVMCRELRDVAWAVEDAIEELKTSAPVLEKMTRLCAALKKQDLGKEVLELAESLGSAMAGLESASEIMVATFDTVLADANAVVERAPA